VQSFWPAFAFATKSRSKMQSCSFLESIPDFLASACQQAAITWGSRTQIHTSGIAFESDMEQITKIALGTKHDIAMSIRPFQAKIPTNMFPTPQMLRKSTFNLNKS